LLQLAVESAHRSGTVFNSGTYCILVRAVRTLSDAKRVFNEAVAANQVSPQLGIAVLELKGAFKEAGLAQTVYKQFHANGITADLLYAIINIHIKRGEHEIVCDLHQKHLTGTEFEPKKQQAIIGSALACARSGLITQVLQALKEVPKHVALVKAVGAQQGIKAAEAVFALCPEQNFVLHNALLDICVEQGDLVASERWMRELVSKDMADVVTYNTLMKVHLNQHQFKRARAVIEKMRQAGFSPNLVTFHAILDATLTACKGNMSEAWGILDEMEACGLKPNHITCSILLKSVQNSSNQSDVEWTIQVVNSIEDIDEILLSSVVEACVRVNRGDLLSGVLRRQRGKAGPGRVEVKGAHTYGSLIRGHGFIHDLDGVWATWREMRTRQIVPTSITLGCMVEALVMNEDPDAGYDMIKEMLADRQCRGCVNAVIYCSVLKGLSHQKRMETLWPIYQEMLEKRMDFSIITYNTLVDACARCGHMDKVPVLLKDMQTLGIEPNVITYSTILKGHCQAGDVELGFQVLQRMREETKLVPDEIMYNSLLDGCARSTLYESGMAVVEDMQKAGVRPSNYTLAILVKLASRAAKLDKAFELAESISKKYRFRLNGHVYTNLLQGCICHQDHKRGLGVLAQMLREQVRPEARAYVLVIRGCMAAGDCALAAQMLRLACGLPCTSPQFSQFGTKAPTPKISECVSDTLRTLADRGHGEDLVGPLLQDLKRLQPAVRIEPQVVLHITNRMIGTKGGHQVRSGSGRSV
jgi:pentatricopeptide repeat protein